MVDIIKKEEKKRYTATIGGKTVSCTAGEWPDIAAEAFDKKQKAYLVDNETRRVVGTA